MDYGVLSVNLNLFKSGNTMLKMQYYDLNASVLFCSDLHKKPRANKVLYPLTTKNIRKKIINNKLTSNLSTIHAQDLTFLHGLKITIYEQKDAFVGLSFWVGFAGFSRN